MKKELRRLKLKHDLVSKIECTSAENEEFAAIAKEGKALPCDVFEYVNSEDKGTGEFYKISENGLTPEEKEEYIRLKQCRDINIIKNCTVFFTVLAALGLALGIINYIALMM